MVLSFFFLLPQLRFPSNELGSDVRTVRTYTMAFSYVASVFRYYAAAPVLDFLTSSSGKLLDGA